MSDEPVDLDRLDELAKKATPGPWRWTGFCGSPQLEGANYAAEMNPILVAQGCGNKLKTSEGVEGCMANKLRDPLRACPLHPDEADRDFIAAANPETVRYLVARARRAQEAEKSCVWSHADEDSDLWEGTCGVAWCLTDGSPKENDMRYCPRCGGALEESKGSP